MMRNVRRWCVVGSLTLAVSVASGCGDDDAPTNQRGFSGKGGVKPATAGRKKPAGREKAEAVAAAEPAKPKRPRSEPLTRENFGPETRDPFKSFLNDQTLDAVEEAPVVAERQREVRMAGYNFEDLSLAGIIRSKRGVGPRALFVASDGISGTIQQGEYFSRAEVLLSSVNAGYVEIEIVDENLAKGLNLATGETRAIYLKRE